MTTPKTLARATEDDLAPSGYQFPLARPTFDIPLAAETTESGPMPFGVQFFRPTGVVQITSPIPYRYDTQSQVAVTDDGAGTPLIELPVSWDRTTTGGADGKGPNVEEFTMDYAGDHQ